MPFANQRKTHIWKGDHYTRFFAEISGNLHDALDLIEREESDFVQCMKRCVATCSEALVRLLEFAQATGFGNAAEEIAFFRTMKPQVECLLLYHNSQLRIELARPMGGADAVRRYYEAELGKITRFYEDNRFLVTYYRSGETLLDDRLFVRAAGTVVLGYMPVANHTTLSSLCDGFVANLLANERLALWINKAMVAGDEPRVANATAIRWTDTKRALIELLYAWYRKGSFNNGQAALKDIADLLEKSFGVELGNYYRTFQELRIRKIDRTSYLNDLTRVLIEYMDETDLNYKG